MLDGCYDANPEMKTETAAREPDALDRALDRFADAGAKAWADVPDHIAWVREQRGGAPVNHVIVCSICGQELTITVIPETNSLKCVIQVHPCRNCHPSYPHTDESHFTDPGIGRTPEIRVSMFLRELDIIIDARDARVTRLENVVAELATQVKYVTEEKHA